MPSRFQRQSLRLVDVTAKFICPASLTRGRSVTGCDISQSALEPRAPRLRSADNTGVLDISDGRTGTSPARAVRRVNTGLAFCYVQDGRYH